ncbi:transposase [Streptomyces sp. NRRL F-5122]|uniref:transposase n=1 Tax=Streptomyces sp. NRRL F-5122 TaxID=1609098 RepID=UPI000A969712|nr:transposase [Streptomyces sp. NRRL F-5122]
MRASSRSSVRSRSEASIQDAPSATALLALVHYGVATVALDVAGRVEALLHQVDRPGHRLYALHLGQPGGRTEPESALRLAANLAADVEAWTRLLGLHDVDGLADAEPDTPRYKLLHLPARLVRHTRRRVLKIPDTWPWRTAFTTCWQRLSELPAVT